MKFFRSEVARVLGVTPATIANREKRGIYPHPTREVNNYRSYDLSDIVELQRITFGHPHPQELALLLYERGVTDVDEAASLIDKALGRNT